MKVLEIKSTRKIDSIFIFLNHRSSDLFDFVNMEDKENFGRTSRLMIRIENFGERGFNESPFNFEIWYVLMV